MAISRDSGSFELDEGLHQIEEESKVSVVYIVDSFGNLYQETTEDLVKRYKGILKQKKSDFTGIIIASSLSETLLKRLFTMLISSTALFMESAALRGTVPSNY